MNFTNLFSLNLLAKTIIIEEVAQAKRSDGGVEKETEEDLAGLQLVARLRR